jgi:hypothetical protein
MPRAGPRSWRALTRVFALYTFSQGRAVAPRRDVELGEGAVHIDRETLARFDQRLRHPKREERAAWHARVMSALLRRSKRRLRLRGEKKGTQEGEVPFARRPEHVKFCRESDRPSAKKRHSIGMYERDLAKVRAKPRYDEIADRGRLLGALRRRPRT